MSDLVRLTVVPDEGAALALCALLDANGIRATYRGTDLAAGGWDGAPTFGGWREVLVRSDDLERAIEVAGPAQE